VTDEPRYWVEARGSVKDALKVISYGVWYKNAIGARECVKRFSVARKGGREVALHLANKLRDDLIAAIE
jgi:hypothetical protein